jgi:tetratricopeptide (TPR) repeat protein
MPAEPPRHSPGIPPPIFALLAAALLPAFLSGCEMSSMQGQFADTRLAAQVDKPAVTAGMPAEDRDAFDEGVTLVSQLRYAEAQQRFQRVLRWYQAFGDAPMAAETIFWLGFCNEKQGRTAQAWEYYDRLLKQYPTAPAAAQAARRRAALPPIGGPPAAVPPAGPFPVLAPRAAHVSTQPTSRPN